eukprot:COSAG05_NODE_2468_length_3027_cov_1.333675_2_plen_131_part_00
MIRPCVGPYANGAAAATLRKCMDLGCSGLVLPVRLALHVLLPTVTSRQYPPAVLCTRKHPSNLQRPHAVNAQNVESVADLDAIRDAIWLPPRGTRRPGGAGNAWVPDFKAATWRQAVEDYFIVIPMIESR